MPKSKKINKNSEFSFTVNVCAHDVECWYELDGKDITDKQEEYLKEEGESRAKAMIIEGYRQGELNYESEELSVRGWWTILN